jgi:hypothetical protein
MTSIGSWRFWVIVALALGTLACANRERRERKEEAREERRERAEARRAERQGRTEQRRAERSSTRDDEPKSSPAARPAPSTNKQTTSTLTPVSTAPSAALASSKIVFMRPHAFGGAIQASVFDVTGSGDAKFIGLTNMHTQLSYSLAPGRYIFMVVGESADFMEANIAAGKTYYALVVARPGAWKARFSFVPVRDNEKRVDQWERTLRPVTTRNEAWARKNASSIESKRTKYYEAWSSKPESQRAGQTLNAEDGR